MADRIGVINKGELILVEEKTALMQKLGKKQLTLQSAGAADGDPAELADWPLALKADGHELEYTFDAQRTRTGISVAAAAAGRAGHRLQGSATRARARSRTSSSSLVSERHMSRWPGARVQPPRRLGHLPLRDGAGAAHAVAEHGHAGDHHLALLRGVRLGHRLAHDRRRRRALRRLHRAGPDHAVAVHREHLQRLVRHLLPEVHRHDLRAAVGAGLVPRDRPRLRRRGGDQVDHPGPDHPGHGALLRAGRRSSTRSGWSPSWC